MIISFHHVTLHCVDMHNNSYSLCHDFLQNETKTEHQKQMEENKKIGKYVHVYINHNSDIAYTFEHTCFG